jgi:hypothetical protein
MNVTPLAGALGGATTLALGYAVLRRAGVTRVDLAAQLAPGHPLAGRLAQVAAGTVACLPAALLASPRRGVLTGLGAGAVAATTQRGVLDRALALATHGAAGLVAATLSRAARERQRGAP